jgi:hypothetical protein
LRINNLSPGVYAIRIINRASGVQMTNRLVVSER